MAIYYDLDGRHCGSLRTLQTIYPVATVPKCDPVAKAMALTASLQSLQQATENATKAFAAFARAVEGT